MAYYVDLTEEQMNRLTTIVACHIDLNLTDEINKAMNAKNVSRLTSLISTKDQDSDILSKLYTGVKTELKEYSIK